MLPPMDTTQPWERWYRCAACDREHAVEATRWRCDCGGVLDLVGGDPRPSLAAARGDAASGLWRWRSALPFAPDDPAPGVVTMGEGTVPVVRAVVDGLTVAASLELASPTLSFKDRGASVLVATAHRLGAGHLVADSSGNAGTAIAAYAARAGMTCEVFVAASTSAPKLAQVRAHGAELRLVDGSREAVAAAAIERVGSGAGFYASHVWNPFFLEGTKTWAFDVVLALDRAPDTVVLPVGNGTLLLGAARGFAELLAVGAIDRLPRIVAVQAAGCAPIAAAFEAGGDHVTPAVNRGTVAEGIAIAAPARGDQCLAAVRASGGVVVTVEDGAIASARAALARQGLYVEPTAAATVAGVGAAGLTDADGAVALPLCGAGLKAPEAGRTP